MDKLGYQLDAPTLLSLLSLRVYEQDEEGAIDMFQTIQKRFPNFGMLPAYKYVDQTG